jgi:hypothetical protein
MPGLETAQPSFSRKTGALIHLPRRRAVIGQSVRASALRLDGLNFGGERLRAIPQALSCAVFSSSE